MSKRDLLKTLLNCSEKAANIAQKIRADENLLSLLVQEKIGEDSNPRFVNDFKTLADVLIQETVRYEVSREFPELANSIFGEEEPVFTNTLGETVHLQVNDDQCILKEKLSKLLNGNSEAVEVIISEVYQIVDGDCHEISDIPDYSLNYEELGIWIDPIDATQEYIKGDSIFTDFPGITSTGLDCVTVLIGVFDKINGHPLIGVINQPFNKKLDKNLYKSKIYWGLCIDNIKLNNIEKTERTDNIAIFSSSESSETLDKFKYYGYELAFSAGAGHKILKVITNEVAVFAITKPSTFVWDTCAPHAILNSIGGGIIDLNKSLEQNTVIPLVYTNGKCNTGGLIAYSNINEIGNILEKMKYNL